MVYVRARCMLRWQCNPTPNRISDFFCASVNFCYHRNFRTKFNFVYSVLKAESTKFTTLAKKIVTAEIFMRLIRSAIM